MPKALFRFIALLLIPCLLMEPLVAAGFESSTLPHFATFQNLFTNQAVVAALEAAFERPRSNFHPKERFWFVELVQDKLRAASPAGVVWGTPSATKAHTASQEIKIATQEHDVLQNKFMKLLRKDPRAARALIPQISKLKERILNARTNLNGALQHQAPLQEQPLFKPVLKMLLDHLANAISLSEENLTAHPVVRENEKNWIGHHEKGGFVFDLEKLAFIAYDAALHALPLASLHANIVRAMWQTMNILPLERLPPSERQNWIRDNIHILTSNANGAGVIVHGEWNSKPSNKIAGIKNNDEHNLAATPIRRVLNTDKWPTYVVADPLFTLLSSDDENLFSLAVPHPDSPGALQNIPEGAVAIASIATAKRQGKTGAEELEKLVEQGDVIFVSASALTPSKESISDDPASPYLDRNEDDAIILMLWQGRFDLALNRWRGYSPDKWKTFNKILKSLKNASARTKFPKVSAQTLEFLAAEPTTWLLAVRDRTLVNTTLREIFPAPVADDLIQFLTETRPTLEEAWETRALATGLPNEIGGSKNFYADVHQRVVDRGRDIFIGILEHMRGICASDPEASAMLEELIALHKLPPGAQTSSIKRRTRELMHDLGMGDETLLQHMFPNPDDKDPFRGPGGDSALGEPADKLARAKQIMAEKNAEEAVPLLDEAAETVARVIAGLAEDSELLPAARALQNEIRTLLFSPAFLEHKPSGTPPKENSIDVANLQNGRDYLVDIFSWFEISRDADDATIKSAYRKLMGMYHPDKYKHLAPIFQRQTEVIAQNLQWAYITLNDPTKRAAYEKQLADWKGPISTNGFWVYSPDWWSEINALPISEGAVEEMKKAFLPQIAGYNPETHQLLEKLTAENPGDPDIHRALEKSLAAEDMMLAVEEQFRWMQAGFKDRQPVTYPKAGYLEAAQEEINSAREQVTERAQTVAQKQLLLAQSGQLKLIGPGGEDQTEKALADPDITGKLVAAEVRRFEGISSKIEEIAQRREDLIETRLEKLRIEYRPAQRKFYPRLIVTFGTKEHQMWAAFKFEDGFARCVQDDSISEEEMQKLTDEKETRKWIRKGYNVIFLDFREGLDFHDQLEEAVNRHSENLQRQVGNKKQARRIVIPLVSMAALGVFQYASHKTGTPHIFAVMPALVLVALDQITKWAAVRRLIPVRSIDAARSHTFSFVHSQHKEKRPLIVVSISMVLAMSYLIAIHDPLVITHPWLNSLFVGAVLSHLLEISLFGSVTNWLSFKGKLRFNLADIALYGYVIYILNGAIAGMFPKKKLADLSLLAILRPRRMQEFPATPKDNGQILTHIPQRSNRTLSAA